MNDTRIPQPNPEYTIEELDGEMVLFHQSGRTIMHLNRTAVLIWQLCDGQRRLADMVQLLITAYPDAAAEIEADVGDILTTLVSNGAIVWK